ncbi:MAG: LOG family protein [Candidatus Methylomirabilales bacterium]
MWHGCCVVTIFGSSRPGPDSPAYARAERLGLALARHGWVVCNGGYGGTMAATARGARRAGGEVIGITCALYGGSPNPYLTHHEEASDLFARLGRLLHLGDAYVILPGGSGTLLELALVLEYQHKQLMPPKPVLLLGSYWRSTVVTAQREHDGGKAGIQVVRTPEAVVRALAKGWGTSEGD